MPGRTLKTRTNDAGYHEFEDPSTGQWTATHRRVAEKKLGGLRRGFHVHHLDQDKTNNRSRNLVEVHPKVHGTLHTNPDACLRCGRNGHWATACYAKTFKDGSRLKE